MIGRVGPLVLAMSLAVPLAAAAPARGADAVVASNLEQPTSVDAYGGRAVWSGRAPDGVGLIEFAGGQVKPDRLPIASRPTRFDVDLGPGRRGETLAVYSRCRNREPANAWTLEGAHGCDLYVYSFATRRERPLRRANSKADEYFPTVWRGRVAFTRTYHGKRRALYWRPLSGRGPSRRMRLGTSFGGVPQDLDMRGRRVALVLNLEYGAEIRLTSPRGAVRRIGVVPGSGAAAQDYRALGPSVTRDHVYWLLRQAGDPPYFSELRRYDLAGGGEERALSLPHVFVTAFAQDGEVAYYARNQASCPAATGWCQESAKFDVHRADGLLFAPAPPIQLR